MRSVDDIEQLVDEIWQIVDAYILFFMVCIDKYK